MTLLIDARFTGSKIIVINIGGGKSLDFYFVSERPLATHANNALDCFLQYLVGNLRIAENTVFIGDAGGNFAQTIYTFLIDYYLTWAKRWIKDDFRRERNINLLYRFFGGFDIRTDFKNLFHSFACDVAFRIGK